ncbi:MAG: hypothetical protein PHI78_02280 [Clostridia bacterium]|nr:hypothetical protein [Clostridia bacterium]
MATKKSGANSGGKKTVSKSTQKKKTDLAKFATGVIAAGVAVAANKSKDKTAGQKVLIGIFTAVIVIALLFCGTMYYLDLPPFDFTVANSDLFKFYTYETYDYEVDTSGVDAEILNGQLKIHYIDVGQGDCIFIQFPDGKTMLIDGGKDSSVLANGVIDYLTALYPEDEYVTIDYCMLTHCDSDHSGSLDNIIASDKINVLSVYQPMVYSEFEFDPLVELYPDGNYATITTTVYENFVKAVYNERESGILTDIYYNLQGESISGVGWTIHIYNPTEQMYAKLGTAQEKNNISPILLLTYGNVKLLFTGDADEAAEQNFIANVENNLFGDGFDGDVDVLKVAHHGGEQSTSAEFLALVQPEYAVISVGATNTYGHPSDVTLDRINAVGAFVYRTDLNGNIVLTVFGGNITIAVAKTALNLAVRFLIFAK